MSTHTNNSVLHYAITNRLPTPLAATARKAMKLPPGLNQTLAAGCLWEAGLRLLYSVALVEYGALPAAQRSTTIDGNLPSIMLPSLGTVWAFARDLTTVLAAHDAGFQRVQTQLKTPVESVDVARCWAILQSLTTGQAIRPKTKVTPFELFDLLPNYRNRELGHGAPGQGPEDQYTQLSVPLLNAVCEILVAVNPLAGRELLFVSKLYDTREHQARGELYDLTPPFPQQLAPLPNPRFEAKPAAERLYVASAGQTKLLWPLVDFELDSEHTYFFNGDKGDKKKADFLCYENSKHKPCASVAHELRQLISGADFTTPSAADTDEPAEPMAPPAPTVAPAVERIDGYTLLRVIRRSPQATVFLAREESVGREVVLKRMAEYLSLKESSRFLSEISTLASVTHDHIVRFFQSGLTNTSFYYVMELIRGANLLAIQQRLAARPVGVITPAAWQTALTEATQQTATQQDEPVALAPRDFGLEHDEPFRYPPPEQHPVRTGSGPEYIRHLVKLFIEVVHGVQTLHEHAIIHRDIKPENIMWRIADGKLILVDFGFAKQQNLQHSLRFSQDWGGGTFRYASPEQILNRPLQPTSDVYSLGATLWEMLTLRPLFDDRTTTSLHDLQDQILRQPPTSPRTWNPSIPADLENIVLRCLEKTPAKRYATAADLAMDLANFLGGRPVAARRITWLDRRWRAFRGNWVVYSSLLAIIVILSVSFGVTYHSWQQEAEQRGHATKNANNARMAQKNAEKAQAESKNHATKATEAAQQEKLARETAEQARRSFTHATYDLARSHFAQGRAIQAREALRAIPPETRSTIWRHLMHQFRTESHTVYFSEQGSPVLGWSPDGTQLAAGCGDHVLRIHELATQQQYELRGHQGLIRCLAWHPDGTTIATGSFDHTIRLWDTATHDSRIIVQTKANIHCMAWSSDGRHLAFAGANAILGVWDRTTNAVTVFADHKANIWGVAWSPDGKRLASTCRDGLVNVRDIVTRKLLLTHRINDVGTSLSWNPDGKTLAIGSADRQVRVLEWATKQVKEAARHDDYIGDVAWSPDGRWLASGSHDQTIKIGERMVETGTVRPSLTIPIQHGPINSVVWSPDGQRLAVGCDDGTARIVDRRAHEGLARYEQNAPCNGVAWSGDGHELVTANDDGTVTIRHALTGAMRSHSGHENSVWCVHWNPLRRQFASGSLGQEVMLWTHERGAWQSKKLAGHTSSVWCVAWHPEGQWMASGSLDTTVRVWDATGQAVRVLEGHRLSVKCVAWHPAGTLLASGGLDNAVILWTRDGVEKGRLTEHTDGVHALAWSPDGRTLATADGTGVIRLWDMATSQFRELRYHRDKISSLAWHPDGQQLVSAGDEGQIVLWDIPSQERHELYRQEKPIYGVAYSPDGLRLAWVNRSDWVALHDMRLDETLNFHDTSGEARGFAWHPDSQRIAAGYDDNALRIWDRHSKQMQKLTGHRGAINDVAWSPNGQLIATASNDMSVRVWNPADPQRLSVELLDFEKPVTGVWWSDDGRYVIALADKSFSLWNVATGQLERQDDNTPVKFARKSTMVSPDGRGRASTEGRAVVVTPHLLSPRDQAFLPYHTAFRLESAYLLARDAAQQHDYFAAAFHIRQALERNPTVEWNWTRLLQHGLALGDHHHALAWCTQQLAAHPEMAPIWRRRATARTQAGDWEGAWSDAITALVQRPKTPGGWPEYAATARERREHGWAWAWNPAEVGQGYRWLLEALEDDQPQLFRERCAAFQQRYRDREPWAHLYPVSAVLCSGLATTPTLAQATGQLTAPAIERWRRDLCTHYLVMAAVQSPDLGGLSATALVAEAEAAYGLTTQRQSEQLALGALYCRAGQNEKAIKYLELALAQDSSSWGRCFLALTHHQRGERPQALARYQETTPAPVHPKPDQGLPWASELLWEEVRQKLGLPAPKETLPRIPTLERN